MCLDEPGVGKGSLNRHRKPAAAWGTVQTPANCTCSLPGNTPHILSLQTAERQAEMIPTSSRPGEPQEDPATLARRAVDVQLASADEASAVGAAPAAGAAAAACAVSRGEISFRGAPAEVCSDLLLEASTLWQPVV